MTSNGFAVLFGGYIGDGYSNEVYIADLINERWGKPIISGKPPLPRESFGMVYHLGNVWVIGGYATGVLLNDLNILQIDQLKWEQASTFGTIPDPR